MSASYFKVTPKYFWQWEENGNVISIPNGSTIAYRAYAADVLNYLAIQGLPPFGALLLSIIATNEKGGDLLNIVTSIITKNLKDSKSIDIIDGVAFLKLLTQLPNEYKNGNKRLLLFQAIFQDCHNITSTKKAKHICQFISKNTEINFDHNKSGTVDYIIARDFKTLDIIYKKLNTVEAILNEMASVTELPQIVELEEPAITETNTQKDYIDELIDNPKTFHSGSLVRRIWSGLNIPFQSVLPSKQSLGGISDLTNKGDFDKLLISEFANDDLVFLSRIANNEALYIQREIPPQNNQMQRIILIDVSLKNWGTPKVIAFATMLAIAKHPKSNITCTAFTIGNYYKPINFEDINGVIEGLQNLEGSINAGKGLIAYLTENKPNAETEIFVITEPTTLKQVEMLKALNDFQKEIAYIIHPDSDGNIDIYKKQQSSKKHIQHILLPLNEIWKKQPKPTKTETSSDFYMEQNFPLLFGKPSRNNIYLNLDEEYFLVSPEKILYRKCNGADGKSGWDLMDADLPFKPSHSAIGKLENGEILIFLFKNNIKTFVILNVNTGAKLKDSIFNWKNYYGDSLFFEDNAFVYKGNTYCWKIDAITGSVEQIDNTIIVEPEENPLTSKATIIDQYSNFSILKNVNKIQINLLNNLVLNGIHEICFFEGRDSISFDEISNNQFEATADKLTENVFSFFEGSTITIHKAGLLIFKSNNTTIPTFYIPTILLHNIAAASETEFAGRDYHYKQGTKITVGEFYKKYYKPFMEQIIVYTEQSEVNPEYPGGEKAMNKFISKEVKYPKMAFEMNVQGRVFVRFTIDAVGFVTNVHVPNPIHPLLDEEAIRVVKAMPIWKPGTQAGKPCAVTFIIPINFNID
ncbi:MAG: TonB family protein [Candidatus Methylacidiphilales bacterium]